MRGRLSRLTARVGAGGWHSRHTVLAVAFLAALSTNVVRVVISPLLPAVIDRFDVSTGLAGLALTGMWAAVAVAQFPGGLLADRYGERRVVFASLGLATLGGGLLSLAPSFTAFAAACARRTPPRRVNAALHGTNTHDPDEAGRVRERPATGADGPGIRRARRGRCAAVIGLESRVAYPRLALWTVVGAVLFLLSGLVNVLLVAVDNSLVLVSFALKYLGASLFAMGAFFYCLNWSIDYGPDFLRRLFT